MDLLKRIWKEEEGQGLVEYGLILLVMVIIGIAVAVAFQPQIEKLFEGIAEKIKGAPAEIEAGQDG